MKTVNIVSGRGYLQDCEVRSSFETGAHLVSVISKGLVIALCIQVQVCVFFFFNTNFKVKYLVFNLACPCM